jgi:hypothetical protein
MARVLSMPQSSPSQYCAPGKGTETAVSEARTDGGKGGREIEMVEAKEVWSEYRLSDGTRLRVKPVMLAVFCAEGERTADGEPVYNMKATLVTDIRTPATNQPG